MYEPALVPRVDGEQVDPGTAAAPEPGEVPAGYTAGDEVEHCGNCIFFTGRADRLAGPGGPRGDCTVHGLPPYDVEAGGWCPAWEPSD
jgi:hypothetical protein